MLPGLGREVRTVEDRRAGFGHTVAALLLSVDASGTSHCRHKRLIAPERQDPRLPDPFPSSNEQEQARPRSGE